MEDIRQEKEVAASVERRMGTVLESMRSRERSSNVGTPSERQSGNRLSAQSAESPSMRSPCLSANKPASLSDSEAKALAASIERKMGNVLESMRSRNALSSHGSSGPDRGGPGRVDGSDTSNTAPGTSERDMDPKLGLSEDDFETFSSADDDEDPMDGMPVDSMINFVPATKAASKDAGGAGVLRKERGNLAGKRATKKLSDPRERKGQKEEAGLAEANSTKSGHGMSHLMKKLTAGKFSSRFSSPRKGNNE